jgi:hypothetical protein
MAWITQIECEQCGERYEGDGAPDAPRLCYGCSRRAKPEPPTLVVQDRLDLEPELPTLGGMLLAGFWSCVVAANAATLAAMLAGVIEVKGSSPLFIGAGMLLSTSAVLHAVWPRKR